MFINGVHLKYGLQANRNNKMLSHLNFQIHSYLNFRGKCTFINLKDIEIMLKSHHFTMVVLLNYWIRFTWILNYLIVRVISKRHFYWFTCKQKHWNVASNKSHYTCKLTFTNIYFKRRKFYSYFIECADGG